MKLKKAPAALIVTMLREWVMGTTIGDLKGLS